MSNDLVPSGEEMRIIESMAKCVIDAKHLEKIGGVAGATAIALYAREIGIPIMGALYGGIRPVLGKVEISPQMMNAMIRKAGHKLKTLEHTDYKCTIWGKRKDTGEEMTVSFTVDDAKKARIFKEGGAWTTYPKNMNYKSSLANLAKWLFADVINMAGVEGEFDSNFEHIGEEIIEVQEQGPTTKNLEIGNKPVVEPVELMSMSQDCELMELVGTDIDYRNRIFSSYNKSLGKEIKSFMDIPAKDFALIKSKVQAHNAEREKESK